MAGDTPSDEAVSLKAYELWEARGRPHGSGQEDWERAKQLLMQEQSPSASPARNQPSAPRPAEEPVSPVEAFTDSILGVTSAAIGAATQMMEGFFGGATALKPTAAKPDAPPAEGEKLVAAERRLQVEAEARVQKGALDAAGTRKPDPV